MRRLSAITLISLLLVAAGKAFAGEVYRWVDEDGVHHFSQETPPPGTSDVERITLPDDPSPAGETGEDPFNIEATAKRTAELREEMNQRREAARERRQSAPQPVVIYQEAPRYAAWPVWWDRPDYRPPYRPPHKPVPPIERPPPSVPFRPPGRSSN